MLNHQFLNACLRFVVCKMTPRVWWQQSLRTDCLQFSAPSHVSQSAGNYLSGLAGPLHPLITGTFARGCDSQDSQELIFKATKSFQNPSWKTIKNTHLCTNATKEDKIQNEHETCCSVLFYVFTWRSERLHAFHFSISNISKIEVSRYFKMDEDMHMKNAAPVRYWFKAYFPV